MYFHVNTFVLNTTNLLDDYHGVLNIDCIEYEA